jgi:hypothetical protein
MRLDDAFHNGEAKTSTPAPNVVGLPEPIEELRQVLLSDTHPTVTDPELDSSILRPSPDYDGSALSGELDRIADQIFEDLEEPIAIGPDVGNVGGDIAFKREECRRGEILMSIDAVGDGLSCFDDARLDRQKATLHSRHIEKVLNKAIHSNCRPLNGVYRPAGAASVSAKAPKKRRRRDDGSERIAKIVSHKTENLFSCANRRLGEVIEERVVKGERRPPGELLRHAHILRPIAKPGATPHG